MFTSDVEEIEQRSQKMERTNIIVTKQRKTAGSYTEVNPFLVWENLCIGNQRHFNASEKLVKKDKQRVMKDKCSNCLIFHFIRKLTTKKLCPFAIENLNLPSHSKMAPGPLFEHQVLHNNSLT